MAEGKSHRGHPMTVLAPERDPHLSSVETLPTIWQIPTHNIFGRSASVRRLRLDEIEAKLAQVKAEYAQRCEKVEAMTEYLANLEAVRHLGDTAPEIANLVLKLDAETEQRNRLAMAIRGLERVVKWRMANPLPA